MSVIVAEPAEDKTAVIYRFPNNTTPRTPYQPTGNLAGYHKVEEDYRYSLKHVTLFDGDHETTITVDDTEYDYRDAEHSSPHVARTIGEHPGLDTDTLYHAPIEHDWRLKWKAWRGEPEPGLHATIIKGRRKGGHGTVTRVYPIRNVYGAWVADYVELDNGTRTNANNCEYETKE